METHPGWQRSQQREQHDPANQHCGGSGIERRRRAKPVIAVKDSSLLHSLSPPTFNLATASSMTTTTTTTTTATTTTRMTSVHYAHILLFPPFFFFYLFLHTVTPKSRTAPPPVFLFDRERTNDKKVRKTR